MPRLAELAAIAAALAFVFVSSRLNAQPQVDCQAYAGFAAQIAQYRELGADLRKVIEKVRRDNPAGLVQEALVRETKRVYAEASAEDQAAYGAYKRCQAQLGRIWLES